LKEKLHSASDIAQMGLPGLPTSRDNIRARAEKENWYYEEIVGQGGVRRMYRIPAKYKGKDDPDSAQRKEAPVVGTIVAGSSQVDLEALKLVEVTLERFLVEKGLRIQPEKRAAVVALLYDYIVNKHFDSEDVGRLLTTMTA
jgi:hypothetical protein